MATNIKLICIVLFMGLASQFTQAQAQSLQQKPALIAVHNNIKPAPQKNETLPAPVKITSVEGITEYRLNNGLKVLIFPDASKPTITVNITYLVGSRLEGYGETGMAHLLEHMMFKGSKNHPNVPQELTSHGARPNGTTSYDRTNYFETFSATDENLNWALSLESDRMVNSFIAKKALESEFSVVRNEFERDENDPSGILMERVLSTAYLWHNYGKATIGSKEDIEKVPIENLQAFYHKYYQPDDAVLLVAGKIDEAKVLPLINKYFGKIPRPKRVLQEAYTVEPVQDGERYVELRRTGDVQVVSCGYHISNGAHPDFAAISVLEDVLDNEPAGRLYQALVETKKASSIWGYAEALKDPSFIYFNAEVLKEKSLDDAKHTLLNLLDSLKYNPVKDEEVERAKSKLLKYFDLAYNNSEEVGLTLSEYIAQGDWRLWFLYRDMVEKVTAADVNRVAEKYFKPSNRTIGEFIPDANPDRAIIPANLSVDSLLKGYKGKEKLAEAEEFDPSPENIDKRTKTGSIPGGAKYALLQKSTRGSSVNVNITLHLGTANDLQNKSALADITADMLSKGTTTKSLQEINDTWDKLKAEVSIHGGGQTVTVNIQTTKKNLPDVLKLLNDILHHPSFPANEFAKQQQEDLATIEQQQSDPQALAQNAFERSLSPYKAPDFRYLMTFEEQAAAYKALKVDDAKKFYTDFYNGAFATIAVVGDFDEQPVVSELNAMFQNWESPVKYVRASDNFYDAPVQSQKINTPDKKNAVLMAGFNMELKDNNPDYAALMMGNYMFGGGFLNSRLAERIRQKEGISYGVGSWVSADDLDKNGSFGSYAIYNPENADKLIACYKEELQKMLDAGFTQDELNDARKGLLQQRKLSRAQDNGLAYRLSRNLYIGRTMQFSKEVDDNITALSLEQVNAAMKKWIKPDKISYVQAGDFEKAGSK